MATERSNNGMYLVDLADTVSESATMDELLDTTRGFWSSICEEMRQAETLWVFAPNKRHEGRFLPVAMSVGDEARRESGLSLKNVITVHRETGGGSGLRDAYEEILFFVKDVREYRFHKDAIRTEHVYQGNEWGEDRTEGRSSYHDTAVRRYNPNGKDPGNVWLTEDRSETAGKTVDETRPLARTEAAKRCVRAGSAEGETVHALSVSDDVARTIEAKGRVLDRRTGLSLPGAVSQ